MSEAVRELVRTAHLVSHYLTIDRKSATATNFSKAIAAVESELNKSPAEQHQERLEEVLEWNR